MKISESNPTLTKSELQSIIRLLQKKHRDKSPHFLIEGKKIVQEICNSHPDAISRILIHKDLNGSFFLTLKQHNLFTRTSFLSSQQVKKISTVKSPEGCFALVKKSSFPMDESLSELVGGAYFYLSHLQDPGNLGTIVRLAAAFNFKGIILSEDCIEVFNPRSLRAMSGAFRFISFFQKRPFHDVLNLMTVGFQVVATALSSKNRVNEADFNRNVVFILGNEGSGLTPAAPGDGVLTMRIPHNPCVDSLNVGIAAGIIAHNYFSRFQGE